MENQLYDTIIIGSGPAGLTAAIYNIRANMKTIILAGNQPGGQLTITTLVDNYPGFPNGIGGVKLMMDMQEQVKNLGGEIRQGVVEDIRAITNDRRRFEVALENGETLTTRAVIVATGAKHRWLGIPQEREMIGKGVSGCATCDGFFFKEKVVAVVGGGDSACTEAEFLSRFASKIYMIHRRDSLRATAAEQEPVLNNPKIEMVWDSEVIAINDKQEGVVDKLENIRIKNNKTGEEKILEVDGMFVAIGRDPATEFVAKLVERRSGGQIVVGKNEEYPTMSSMPGIFAAGDCVNDRYMQAVTAAGDGCKAALDAERWIKKE